MALTTTWTVKVGGVASPTDFTSRVQGMVINQQVDVNVIGRGSCQIQLLNKDGALTPGGGGTYSTTDWFAQGVFVSATVSDGSATTVQVFHGLITDFDLRDDGVFSTVTITAQDSLSIAGRSQADNYGVAGTTLYSLVAQASLNLANLYWPRLGKTTAESAWSDLGSGSSTNVAATTDQFATAADLLQTALIPSANDVMWQTTITESGTKAIHNVASISFYNSRTVANSVDMEFDPPASLSGSKLPFDIDTFQQSFNNETLITTAIIDGLTAGTTSQSVQSSAINTYGPRTVSYTSTFSASDADSLNMATKLVNRYGTSRFTPTSLQTSAKLVQRLAADAAKSKWHELLSITGGIWQRAKITWTGSGAASQTAYCVIKGRQILVTPDDAIVTLTLANWYDNHSFILDQDELDYGRLG